MATTAEFIEQWNRQLGAYTLGISGRALLRSGLGVREDAAHHTVGTREDLWWVHPTQRSRQCLGIAPRYLVLTKS